MIYSTHMLVFFGTMCLIVLTEIASSTDENLSEQSHCIEPISYEMNIFPHIHNNSLNVESRVTINVTCQLPSIIKLYFGRFCDKPTIDIVSNYLYNFTSSYWKPLFWSFPENQFKSVYIILGESSLNKSETPTLYIIPKIYQILAKYNCTLNKVTTVFSYVAQSEETKYMILPRFPAEWIFPYWTNPATKATFRLRIYHKKELIAFSHMPGDTILEENTSYTYFPFTPVMSTHFVAIAIVPWEAYFFLNTLEFISDMSYAESLIATITQYIKNKWEDVSWSTSSVALSIFPSRFESIITKNLVLFNKAAIVYDAKTDSLTRKKEITCFVPRSILQELFSDWLALSTQSDFWFMEGFLTFYGVYIFDQIYNESLLKSIMVQTRREILDWIEAFITYDFPVADNSSFISPSSIFAKLWRKHAFSIFYMVTDNHDVYNSMFDEAINLYYNTTSSDTYNIQSNFNTLWSKLLVDKQKTMSLIQILTTVITSWTHIGYPLVQVTRHNNNKTLELIIRDCFLSNIQESCVSTWWIPVTFVKRPQFKIKYKLFLNLDESTLEFTNIKENDFVILMDVPGYRVNYDRKSWKNIARFLKSKTSKRSNLSDVTLAQILDDAVYFLVQNTDYNENPASNNTDNLNIFFDLASSIFHVDNSYIAWYPIFTAFEYLSTIYPYTESAYIKNKLLKILNKFFENTSHTPSSENNVTNQFYYEVLKWTCILNGLECKDIVTAESTWLLQNSAQNKIVASWQRWILCQQLTIDNYIYEESHTWQNLLNMYETQSKIEEMFEFLSCSKHSNNILASIYYLSSNFLPSYGFTSVDLKKSDSVTFLFNIFTKHSKNVALLTSILNAIELHINSFRNIGAIMTCIINNIYSEEGLSMITDNKFLQMLVDLYFAPSFLIDAIEEKTVKRRNVLIDRKNKLRHKPYDATYRYLFLE